MPKNGDIIGDYKIIGKIANGGMGGVYKAHDLKNGGYAAIKKLENPVGFSQDEAIKMFKREADILREVMGFDCFPQFKDYILDNNNYYIAMEYIDGDNLEDVLKIRDLSEEEIKDITLYVLSALEILHKKGIVYRDMKPANIMISNDNKVVLCDFGTARYLKDQKVTNAPTSKTSDTQVGTPDFASPEHFGGLCDERSDLYCLARTIYFCFTKTFDTLFPMKDNINQLTISKSFKIFLIKALEFNKEDRFQNVGEMRKSLKKVKVKKNAGNAVNVVVNNAPMRTACPSWHCMVEVSLLVLFIFITFFLLAIGVHPLNFGIFCVVLLLLSFGGLIRIGASDICLFHWITGGLKNIFGKIGGIFGLLFGALFGFLKKINFGGWKDFCRFWGSYCPPIIFLINWFGWWTIGKVVYFTGVMNWFWIIAIGAGIFIIWSLIYFNKDSDNITSIFAAALIVYLLFYLFIGGIIYDCNFSPHGLLDKDNQEFYLEDRCLDENDQQILFDAS